MADVHDSQRATSDFPSSSHNSEKDTLITRLDELLEKYLNTLDAYQKAREQLWKQLSSGYLSLAEANFKNRASSIHYGQDCYDERMQALRKVNIVDDQSDLDDEDISVSVSSRQEESKDSDEDSKKQETAEEPEVGSTQDSPNGEKKSTSKEAQKSTDPIRWFGILVPPALRSAQASFISVIEGPIPRLVMMARDLRSQEVEIGRVRKQIKRL